MKKLILIMLMFVGIMNVTIAQEKYKLVTNCKILQNPNMYSTVIGYTKNEIVILNDTSNIVNANGFELIYIESDSMKGYIDASYLLNVNNYWQKIENNKVKNGVLAKTKKVEHTTYENHSSKETKYIPSKTVYTGPRGGHYHYSKSGKKVYEKR